jgi:hypothetical protein
MIGLKGNNNCNTQGDSDGKNGTAISITVFPTGRAPGKVSQSKRLESTLDTGGLETGE